MVDPRTVELPFLTPVFGVLAVLPLVWIQVRRTRHVPASKQSLLHRKMRDAASRPLDAVDRRLLCVSVGGFLCLLGSFLFAG